MEDKRIYCNHEYNNETDYLILKEVNQIYIEPLKIIQVGEINKELKIDFSLSYDEKTDFICLTALNIEKDIKKQIFIESDIFAQDLFEYIYSGCSLQCCNIKKSICKIVEMIICEIFNKYGEIYESKDFEKINIYSVVRIYNHRDKLIGLGNNFYKDKNSNYLYIENIISNIALYKDNISYIVFSTNEKNVALYLKDDDFEYKNSIIVKLSNNIKEKEIKINYEKIDSIISENEEDIEKKLSEFLPSIDEIYNKKEITKQDIKNKFDILDF